jgi:hypothetical protein
MRETERERRQRERRKREKEGREIEEGESRERVGSWSRKSEAVLSHRSSRGQGPFWSIYSRSDAP